VALVGPFVRHARYLGAAFDFTGAIAGAALVGWAADRWFGVEPWGIITATLVGVLGGFLRLVTLLRRFERLDRDPEP
jgi:F0F1-type ATP synthase assembly protein I